MASRADTGASAAALAPSLADDALELAASGWAVFPCGADKQPLVARGFHAASSDAAAVAAMPWDRAALIGAAIPDGQIVVDVDPRNGGEETMAALKAAGQRLPRTRRVDTAGGGRHYYLRVPGDVELRGRLGQGVDVKRAGRGYVIVPPSPGYRLARHDPAAKAPEWLVDALRVPARDGAAGEASEPKFLSWEHGTAYGVAALERILGRFATAENGTRNDELNKAAFALAQLHAGGELDGDHAAEALEEVAARVGLGADETRRTMLSGWQAGLAEPRQAPPREEGAEPRGTAGEPLPGSRTPEDVASPSSDGEVRWLEWDVDEPPPEFLLDPILPKSAYVLVYGPTEASKSMVWTAIGCQASQRGIRTTLYSLENPGHVDRDRLRRLRPNRDHFRASNEPLDLNDPRQFQALVEREQAWGARLVIVDTYSHAFSSRSDDGNAKAIEFAVRMRYLMHVVGCTVVVIDHTGYMQLDEPRDASAKRQQVDVAVLMTKVGEWEPGQDARFRMVNKKAARFANPFDFNGRIRGGRGEPLEIVWDGKGPKWTA